MRIGLFSLLIASGVCHAQSVTDEPLVNTELIGDREEEAEENVDRFSVTPYARVTYDDNLFRVANEDEARARFGTSDTDEVIRRAGAELELNVPISRQLIALDADVSRADYQNFGELDHTAIDSSLEWMWKVGDPLDGSLGYTYGRSLSRFDELQQLVQDLVTRQSVYANAGLKVNPRWRLVGGAEYFDVDFDQQNVLDRRLSSGFLELQYVGMSDALIGLHTEFTHGDLQETEFGEQTVTNDYNEAEVSLVTNWQVTPKSSIDAGIGFTSRDRRDPAAEDFSGVTGIISYGWQPTEKTAVSVTALRDVGSLNSQVVDFVETRAVRLDIAWKPTAKWKLGGALAYEDNDFGEDRASAAGRQVARKDTFRLGQISLDYLPLKNLGIGLTYQVGDRNSSRTLSGFDYNRVSAQLALRF